MGNNAALEIVDECLFLGLQNRSVPKTVIQSDRPVVATDCLNLVGGGDRNRTDE
jgi:hypothetical protein